MVKQVIKTLKGGWKGFKKREKWLERFWKTWKDVWRGYKRGRRMVVEVIKRGKCGWGGFRKRGESGWIDHKEVLENEEGWLKRL